MLDAFRPLTLDSEYETEKGGREKEKRCHRAGTKSNSLAVVPESDVVELVG